MESLIGKKRLKKEMEKIKKAKFFICHIFIIFMYVYELGKKAEITDLI